MQKSMCRWNGGISLQNKRQHRIYLCGEKLYQPDDERPAHETKTSPGINIDYAEEYVPLEWRYFTAK